MPGSIGQGAGGAGGAPTPLANTFTSTSTTSALTALKGKELKDQVDALAQQVQALIDAAAGSGGGTAPGTKPRFGYSAANASGDAAALNSLFTSMTPLTGSVDGGRDGSFATQADTTKFTWIAVLNAAAPSGITVSDGIGTGGFSGAQSAGLFTGSDATPTLIRQQMSIGGVVWDFYRSNGKAINFSNFTLS